MYVCRLWHSQAKVCIGKHMAVHGSAAAVEMAGSAVGCEVMQRAHSIGGGEKVPF